MYYVWHTECGRRQAVRHLPPEQVFTGSSPAARSSESNVSPPLYAKGGEIFFCAFLIAGRTDGTVEPLAAYNLGTDMKWGAVQQRRTVGRPDRRKGERGDMSDVNLNGNYCDSRDSYMRDIDDEDVLIGTAAIGTAVLIAIGAVAFAVKAIAKSGGKK